MCPGSDSDHLLSPMDTVAQRPPPTGHRQEVRCWLLEDRHLIFRRNLQHAPTDFFPLPETFPTSGKVLPAVFVKDD